MNRLSFFGLGMNEEKVTLLIDKIVWEKFRRYCAANAFKISAKIQLLLDEEIERGPKTKNLLDMFKEIVESKKDMVESRQTNLDVKRVQEMPAQRADNYMRNNAPTNREGGLARVDNPKMINEGKVPTIDQLMLRKRGS